MNHVDSQSVQLCNQNIESGRVPTPTEQADGDTDNFKRVFKPIYSADWIREPIGSVHEMPHISWPTKCQCITKQSTSCQNRPLYLCKRARYRFEHDVNDFELYLCGIHVKTIDTSEHCIIFQHVDHNLGYKKTYKETFEVVQQIHSPDTYLEHCYTINRKFKNECIKYEKNLRKDDMQATLLGDVDGSYPKEMERLSNILRNGNRIGFDLHRITKENYKEIKRLRDLYLSYVELNRVLCSEKNRPREVDDFETLDKLSFVQEDTCSICLETISRTTGGQLKECKHTFHNTCLKEWLSRYAKGSCPCCRKSIKLPLFAI